jgi:hypothetical protein
MSVLVFITIGLLVQFDVKGVNQSLLRCMAEILFREGIFNTFMLVWFGSWSLVAVVTGWFLQSLVVMVVDWRRENSKPLP